MRGNIKHCSQIIGLRFLFLPWSRHFIQLTLFFCVNLAQLGSITGEKQAKGELGQNQHKLGESLALIFVTTPTRSQYNFHIKWTQSRRTGHQTTHNRSHLQLIIYFQAEV